MMDIIDLSAHENGFLHLQARGFRRVLLSESDARERGARTVVCGGKEACDPHYRVARKRFRYHSVEYVADGAGELAVGDRRYP
jgi:guanyl-specific ribonuclease Sa